MKSPYSNQVPGKSMTKGKFRKSAVAFLVMSTVLFESLIPSFPAQAGKGNPDDIHIGSSFSFPNRYVRVSTYDSPTIRVIPMDDLVELGLRQRVFTREDLTGINENTDHHTIQELIRGLFDEEPEGDIPQINRQQQPDIFVGTNIWKKSTTHLLKKGGGMFLS